MAEAVADHVPGSFSTKPLVPVGSVVLARPAVPVPGPAVRAEGVASGPLAVVSLVVERPPIVELSADDAARAPDAERCGVDVDVVELSARPDGSQRVPGS